MRLLRPLLAVLAVMASAGAAANCGLHDDAGEPSNADQTLCYDGFMIGYDHQNKVADWVMYTVTPDSVAENHGREASFREDSQLPDRYRSTLNDYRGSGYDRGHLAGRATIDSTRQIMEDSFILSNIAPQLPGFNRRGWNELEQYFRQCVFDTSNGVIMITGPVYSGEPRFIGDGVRIADAFYKVAMERSSPYRMMAYLVPHEPFNGEEIHLFRTTVDDVEAQTGLDFFSKVPSTLQRQVEAQRQGLCPSGRADPKPNMNQTRAPEQPAPEPRSSAVEQTPSSTEQLGQSIGEGITNRMTEQAREAAAAAFTSGAGGIALERFNEMIDEYGAPENICDRPKLCSTISSCEEAIHRMMVCGNDRLDGDGDGVPCEGLCRSN